MPRNKSKKCLTRGCNGEVFCRGVCSACYQAAGYRVRKGEVTWEELEEAGLVGSARPGRPPTLMAKAIANLESKIDA